MVSKTAHVVEEVVVGRQATERTEQPATRSAAKKSMLIGMEDCT